MDNQSRNVKVDGKDIAITFKEFELLKYLLKTKRTVVPREVLLEKYGVITLRVKAERWTFI